MPGVVGEAGLCCQVGCVRLPEPHPLDHEQIHVCWGICKVLSRWEAPASPEIPKAPGQEGPWCCLCTKSHHGQGGQDVPTLLPARGNRGHIPDGC